MQVKCPSRRREENLVKMQSGGPKTLQFSGFGYIFTPKVDFSLIFTREKSAGPLRAWAGYIGTNKKRTLGPRPFREKHNTKTIDSLTLRNPLNRAETAARAQFSHVRRTPEKSSKMIPK